MKKQLQMLALLVTLALLVNIQFAKGQVKWRNPGPGAGSDLQEIAIQPDNDDIIYLGGDIEGIFKTTDGGKTWKNINDNLVHSTYGGGIYWTNDIVIDPVDFQKVYFCTANGLFKSTTGGGNWQLIYPTSPYNAEDEGISVATVAVDSNNTSVIYMGLGDRTETGTFATFEPFDDYSGETGLYKSTNGGSTWTLLNTGLPSTATILSIVINPKNSNVVLMSTSDGVYKSTNAGSSWIKKNSGLPHKNCYIMTGYHYWGGIYRLYLSMKVLGTIGDSTTFSGGMFVSDDLGETWDDITSNLPKYDSEDSIFYDFFRFDADPTDPDVVFVGTTRGSGYEMPGVFVTEDGGDTWDYAYMPTIGAWLDTAFFWDPYVFDIKVAPSNPNRVVSIMDDVEISDDAGFNWHQAFSTKSGAGWIGNGLELMNTDVVGFDPSNKDIVYVGYDDFGLFRSDDGATSFIRLDPIQDPVYGNVEGDGIKDILPDPANGDLYISRWGGSQGGFLSNYETGGVLLSKDQGKTMAAINSGLPSGKCDIALDTNSGTAGNRTLYCALYHYGVYKSSNSGTTWTKINNGLGSDAEFAWEIVVDPSNSKTLYLGLNNTFGSVGSCMYKSVDGGQTWAALSSFPQGNVLSIYASPDAVYATSTDNFDWSTSGGLYKSTDGGTTWTKILDNARIIDFDINHANPDVMAAALQQWYMISYDEPAIMLSEDGGATWKEISQGIYHTFFNFVRFNPHKPQQLFTGTAGGGLWVADNLGISIPDNIDPITHKTVNVFPNPAHEIINIETSQRAHSDFYLYDALGKMVVKYSFDGLRTSVDVNELSEGIYSYVIIVNGKTEIGKLVVKH